MLTVCTFSPSSVTFAPSAEAEMPVCAVFALIFATRSATVAAVSVTSVPLISMVSPIARSASETVNDLLKNAEAVTPVSAANELISVNLSLSEFTVISVSKISTPLIVKSPWARAAAGFESSVPITVKPSESVSAVISRKPIEAISASFPTDARPLFPLVMRIGSSSSPSSLRKPLKVVAVLEKPEPDVLSSSMVIAAPVLFERTSLPSSLRLAVTTPPVSALILSTSSSIVLDAEMVKVVAVPTPCSVTVMDMPDCVMVSLVLFPAAPKVWGIAVSSMPKSNVDRP